MDERVALVTGGTKGIGAAICKQLASEGYFVYINYRRDTPEKDNLINEIKTMGGKAKLICFDVCNFDEIQIAINNIVHERIDVLVNNAGFLQDELIYKIDLKTWHTILNTNYFGTVRLFELIKEKLFKSERPSVINIGSISGIKPRAGQAAYAVSKAMIIEWTNVMASLYTDKINFYSVSPGPVKTQMIIETKWGKDPNATKRIPLGRFIEPEEIAKIVYLLDKNNFILSGQNIIYDGGFINTVME